ncbi:UNVERIFIED_CONTAM: hypothetical protein PYX00_007878 [Menopon gallinae]|uniref:4-hydroxy-2-oxoglutarate aldolase, mitochondrial n=1 Tax=Menopon gallinae TaxID=328185 RepID=A0AAW2HL07_9NEOP
MSTTFRFRGFMAPVFTPFNDDEERSLNLEVVPDYAKFLKANKIDGVLVNGTSGEATSQTVDERERVAEAWADAAQKTGQTLMVQVGGTSLKNVRRLASHAEKIGASAILCLADLFHRPKTCDQLIDYLNAVSRAAPRTPLLYYHLPDFTGINVDVKELFEKANRVPNLVGVKYTSTDLETGSACLAAAGDGRVIFLGCDTMLLPAFAMGFDSVIGTTLNMMAPVNLAIRDAVLRGDIESALKTQRILTSAVRSITKYGTWVGTMKSAMNMISPINVGPVREPLSSIPESETCTLCEELNELKDII